MGWVGDLVPPLFLNPGKERKACWSRLHKTTTAWSQGPHGLVLDVSPKPMKQAQLQTPFTDEQTEAQREEGAASRRKSRARAPHLLPERSP